MSTSPHEMFGGVVLPPVKTHSDCKSPGCYKPATFYSHKNIGWCDDHALQLIRVTIKAIDDGSHHELES